MPTIHNLETTKDFSDFRGRARPLDDIDLPRLGIASGLDEIHEVIDVEAAAGAWEAAAGRRCC